MKLCQFLPAETGATGAPQPRRGILDGDVIREISGDLFGERKTTGRSWPAASVRFAAPVAPSKIVCVGKNYRAHAAEMGGDVPAEPLIFLKPPSSVLNPGEPILLPESSRRVDYEGELAVVIGRRCARLPRTEPLAPYILGYTCLNDVTARDLQKKDIQFTRAKSFDTFCPFGPVVETELGLSRVTVETRVNGQRRQHAPIEEMIFPLDVIIRFITEVMTLLPGDVIATGTPAGVGPLAAGDVVEVSVSGVGTLSNPVAQWKSGSSPNMRGAGREEQP